MADKRITGSHGYPILLKDDGQGVYSEVVASSGTVTQAVPDFATAQDLLTAYGNFSGIAPGDFVTRVQTSNGQVITALSGGPLQVGESVVELDVPVNAPCSLEIEASAIRARHQFSTISLYSNGADGLPDVVPNPINIISISQSTAVDGAAYTAVAGTVVTLVLETALPGEFETGRVYFSDWIHISGLVDNRLNYPNCAVSFISADRKTICFGFSDEGTLPSLAVPVITPSLGTAKVNFYNNAAGAHHGAGIRFTGTTTTSAAFWSMFGGGDAQISGTLLGDHRVTVGSTAPVLLNGKMGQFELKATSRFRVDVTPDDVTFYSRPVDSSSAWTMHNNPRTAVKPGVAENLRTRFRLYQPLNMTRPVASIVTVSKAGSTTWTVTTEDAHNLTTGNWVTIKGVRDQTNFPSFATPVQVTVTGANTFTLVSLTGTATSHGGSVILTNGGVDQPGIIGQAVISMSNYTVNPDWLVVTGNTTWTGMTVGDYINVHGNHDDATGADVGCTGAWEVANLSTAQLIVKPVYNIFGVRVSPVTPTLSGTVNCGGSVILRTTLRAHDLQLKQLQGEQVVALKGQGTDRLDLSMPVRVITAPTTAVTQSTAATLSSTDGTGGWFVRPGIVGLPDIASAALTTTTTTAAIANALGNAFQVVIPVTAVAGTNPTLDNRVEESFDGGTNWEPLFDFPRIIAAGHYFSPVLMATGRHIRYVQTIGGTGSPSFTRSVTRNILPFQTAVPTRQYFDRSIVLTTLSSVTPGFCVDGTVDLKLTLDLGAATAAPVLQLQISEDKTKWVDVGSPLTGVANGTVQTIAYGVLAKFARAIVKTAGATVTAGYVQIKGF